MEIKGQLVSLVPFTREQCHEFYKAYVSDPSMWDFTYVYNENRVNDYYERKVLDPSRRFFAIILNGRTIGEIQLKYIDIVKGFGTLSIHLQNDAVKNKGYGTEAERLMIDYAFNELGLNTIYANTVLRNTRSQHILEKIGFVHTHDDDIFRYYKYKK